MKITKEEREAAQAKRKADSEGPRLHPPISCPNIDSALLRTAKAAEIEAKKAATSRKRVKSSEVLP